MLNGNADAFPQLADAPPVSTIAYGPPQSMPSGSGDAGAIPSWIDSPPARAVDCGRPPRRSAGGNNSASDSPTARRRWLVCRPGCHPFDLLFDISDYSDPRTLVSIQQAPPPSPNQLDVLPSFDPNDEEHSTHLKLNQRVFNRPRSMDVKTATGPLLPERVTRLGAKLQVGDVEITPLKVDRRVVSVTAKGFQPEP